VDTPQHDIDKQLKQSEKATPHCVCEQRQRVRPDGDAEHRRGGQYVGTDPQSHGPLAAPLYNRRCYLFQEAALMNSDTVTASFSDGIVIRNRPFASRGEKLNTATLVDPAGVAITASPGVCGSRARPRTTRARLLIDRPPASVRPLSARFAGATLAAFDSQICDPLHNLR